MTNKQVIVMIVGILIAAWSGTAMIDEQLQKGTTVTELLVVSLAGLLLAAVLSVFYAFSRRQAYRQAAWYLDEDVLLAGYTDAMVFYPNKTTQCGFDAQAYSEDDVNKTLFYDLEKAEEVCGSVRVVT